MAAKSTLAKAREYLKNLASTVIQFVGFLTVLSTISSGFRKLILTIAGDWHEIKSSAEVQEMASDIGSGGRASLTYLKDDWWEVSLVICVVLIVNEIRVRLIVGPRVAEREGFAEARKRGKPTDDA